MLLRRKAPQANATDLDPIEDLLKGTPMLEKTIERWFDEATLKEVLIGEQRGLQVGRNEGRTEGVHEGFARAVSLQLQLRFGDVPERVHALLVGASEKQLTHWLGMMLTAK